MNSDKLLELIKQIVVDAGKPGPDDRFGLGKLEIDKLISAFLKESIFGA